MHVTVYTVFNVILLSVKDVYIQAHKYGGWMQGVHTPALLVKSVHINADCPGFQENVPFFSDFHHWTPALKKSYLRSCIYIYIHFHLFKIKKSLLSRSFLFDPIADFEVVFVFIRGLVP